MEKGMKTVKRKLRIASLIMLLIAVVFVVFAFFTMDVPIDLPIPLSTLRIIYKVYPIVMVCLFIASFFVKGDKSSKEKS